MRMIKCMLCIPVRFIVFILMTSVNLFIKVETYIVGPGILILGLFGAFTLINHMWLQLGLLAVMFVAVLLLLLFSVQVEIWLEDLQERVKSFL